FAHVPPFMGGGNPLGQLSMNHWQPAIVALRAAYLPACKAADIYVPIRHLYICRKSSTNKLFYAKQTQFLGD
ncbi:MAG: hypothetical protein ACYS1A_09805, partial [Planctomycetota bacterium]